MFGAPKKKANPYSLNTDIIESITKRLEKERKERERYLKRFRRPF
jgi:hypothetical protein